MTNQNNELRASIYSILLDVGVKKSNVSAVTDSIIQALYAPKPVEKVNKTPKSVDLSAPKVNLIDIASPTMTPEASKVVSDAIERSAEVMNKKPVENGELREQLAAIEHERWADWQKWCHKVLRENNPSPEQGDILERWDRQIATPYAELSEKEKQSDRDQVDRYWQLVEASLAQEKAKWVAEAEKLEHYYSHKARKEAGYAELYWCACGKYDKDKDRLLRHVRWHELALAKLLDKENTK